VLLQVGEHMYLPKHSCKTGIKMVCEKPKTNFSSS
jgi:hypothetical protein